MCKCCLNPPSLICADVCSAAGPAVETEPVETAGPDKTRYASRAAIRGLQQAGMNLPHLRYLHLCGSPVLAADMSCLAIALSAFVASITHLAIDIVDVDDPPLPQGRRFGPVTVPEQIIDNQTAESRRILFGVIALMPKLEGLFVWRWNRLVGEQFNESAALRGLPKLSWLGVDGVPCDACTNAVGGCPCPRHPRGLPFKANPVSYKFSGRGENAKATPVPAQAGAATG